MFFGTDNFSLPSLKILANELYSNGVIKELSVVTSLKSHANPIKLFSEQNNLKIFNYPVKSDFKHCCDIGIVVSFGYLLPKSLIESFPLGIINVHASLLPRWRGAAPIIYSILNGEQTTGVTIMKIHPHKFDIGEILLQKEIDISKTELLPEVHEKLAECGSQILLTTIRDIEFYYKNAQQQNESEATYAPKVDKDLPKIHWNSMTSTQIYNLYRALYSYRNLKTNCHKHIIKIINCEPFNDDSLHDKNHPGHVSYSKIHKCLLVVCSDGSLLKINSLQVDGKRIISASDFNNGFLKKLSKEQKFFS